MQGQRGEKSSQLRCGGDKRETVGETAREMLDSMRREERKTESGEGKEGSVARWSQRKRGAKGRGETEKSESERAESEREDVDGVGRRGSKKGTVRKKYTKLVTHKDGGARGIDDTE